MCRLYIILHNLYDIDIAGLYVHCILDYRYLVDIRWMKQWKKYVGYDTWDQSSAGKETANPGPLDNSNLFKGVCVCVCVCVCVHIVLEIELFQHLLLVSL